MKATRLLKVKSVLAIVLIAVELFAQLTAFHTDRRETPEQSAAKVLAKLEELGYVPVAQAV